MYDIVLLYYHGDMISDNTSRHTIGTFNIHVDIYILIIQLYIL
jgi:hypothetical protein